MDNLTNQQHKILVLDANQRSALASVRALGDLPQLTIYTADSTSQSLAGSSRYSARYLQCPSSETDPQAFLAWLTKAQASDQFSLVLPVTEITSQLILLHHEQLPDVDLPFAPLDTVMQLADKSNLLALAKKLGFATPSSQRYDSTATLDISSLTYPLVLKPCQSTLYRDGAWVKTSVKVVKSEDELRAHLARADYLKNSAFMIQAFIPGHGAGVFCLYHQSEPILFFAHTRLREKPPEGGVSVLSESAKVNPALKILTEQLMSAVNWHGVAMVEFRIAPDGTAYLMEVNTRFWGSLQLSIDAGANFPKHLVCLALNLPCEAITPYRTGQRLRWLLGDVDSLYLFLKSNRKLSSKISRLLSFFNPFSPKTKHEINRWNDLKPAIFEFKIYLKQLLGLD
ncbi:ATP-grasp domain-containing protein [Simiduia curdlanivorans]|uniref:ATP-grasp domain-containing protein n=1 Tax=Simiduia curdlanivorans TaxID=1492769 RepID=A0ABV8V905_9GAMM|nr:ATP-grasp domain-containing protein [Simiduia curdlanivorans]MDN3638499.1 ATP-grasp domain-containing protein [Simiduia curdlanivorans]